MRAQFKTVKRGKPTPKERGLIKGKINSIFARSELRRQVLKAAIIEHTDAERPRVKTWVRCNICKKPEAASYVDVDHIDPKIPVHRSFDEMTLEEYIDRTWCDLANLQVLCEPCHTDKTKSERKLRGKKK